MLTIKKVKANGLTFYKIPNSNKLYMNKEAASLAVNKIETGFKNREDYRKFVEGR